MHLRYLMIGLVALTLPSCLTPQGVQCADGVMCPSDKVCAPAGGACVAVEQLTECEGKPANSDCEALGLRGYCVAHVCEPIQCGNGIIDPGEVCDDGDTDNASSDGLPDLCRSDCRSDFSCGNGIIDGDEACDCGRTDDFKPAQCKVVNSDDPTAQCDTRCTRRCGDGIIAGAEDCEAGVATTETCRSFGFYGGDLSCNQVCRFDLAACSGGCGDGVLQPNEGEVCDPGIATPPASSCVAQGYDFGHLTCAATCTLDIAGSCGTTRATQVVDVGPVSAWTDGTRYIVAAQDGSEQWTSRTLHFQDEYGVGTLPRAANDPDFTMVSGDAHRLYGLAGTRIYMRENGQWTTTTLPEAFAGVHRMRTGRNGKFYVLADVSIAERTADKMCKIFGWNGATWSTLYSPAYACQDIDVISDQEMYVASTQVYGYDGTNWRVLHSTGFNDMYIATNVRKVGSDVWITIPQWGSSGLWALHPDGSKTRLISDAAYFLLDQWGAWTCLVKPSSDLSRSATCFDGHQWQMFQLAIDPTNNGSTLQAADSGDDVLAGMVPGNGGGVWAWRDAVWTQRTGQYYDYESRVVITPDGDYMTTGGFGNGELDLAATPRFDGSLGDASGLPIYAPTAWPLGHNKVVVGSIDYSTNPAQYGLTEIDMSSTPATTRSLAPGAPSYIQDRMWAGTSADAVVTVPHAPTAPTFNVWNGTMWRAFTLPAPTGAQYCQIKDVAVSSASNIVATGYCYGTNWDEFIWRFDGTTWAELWHETVPSGITNNWSLWQSPAGDIYASGGTYLAPGVTMRWHAGAWTTIAQGLGNKVAGIDDNNVYVLRTTGTTSKLWHFNGSSFAEIRLPAGSAMTAFGVGQRHVRLLGSTDPFGHNANTLYTLVQR